MLSASSFGCEALKKPWLTTSFGGLAATIAKFSLYFEVPGGEEERLEACLCADDGWGQGTESGVSPSRGSCLSSMYLV